MTSLAAVMSKPLSRGMPSERPPRPMMMSRSARSFMSTTRFHVSAADRAARCRCAACCRRARRAGCAHSRRRGNRLKCRLMSHHRQHFGGAAARAAPFMPKTGPRLGSRNAAALRTPILARPCTADGGRGLALARRRRRDRGHQHELAVVRTAPESGERQLGLVVTIGFDNRRINADGARDFTDQFHQSFPLVRASRRC